MAQKKYTIGVQADKRSLAALKADIERAVSEPLEKINNGEKIGGLNRSDKAAIKADLMEVFGIGAEQAKMLGDMVRGIIPSDAEGIAKMRKELQETMQFVTGIMEKMRAAGEPTDWMKQGVGFLDQFISMQSNIEQTGQVVSGLEQAIKSLTEAFVPFKEALSITNGAAYFQRFGSQTKAAVTEIAKAKKTLDAFSSAKRQSLRDFAKPDDDIDDFLDLESEEEIREHYNNLIAEITGLNKKISDMQKTHGARTLHDTTTKIGQEYQQLTRSLATAMGDLESLSGHKLWNSAFSESSDQIAVSIKTAMSGAANEIRQAGKELKQIIEGLHLEGLELKVELPDANAAEFEQQINDFIADANKKLKAKPVTVDVDIVSPFKDADKRELSDSKKKKADEVRQNVKKSAEEAGVDIGDSLSGLDDPATSDIVRNFMTSLQKIKDALKTGQKLITAEVKQWRNSIQEFLTLKIDFDNAVIQDKAVDMMNSLQAFLENNNQAIHIPVEVDPIVDDLLEALKDVKINIGVGEVSGNFRLANGGAPKFDTRTSPTQPAAEAQKAESSLERAVEESTQEQSVLKEEIGSLKDSIRTYTERADRSSSQMEDYRRRSAEQSQEIEQEQANLESLRTRQQQLDEKRRTLTEGIKSQEAEMIADKTSESVKDFLSANIASLTKERDLAALQHQGTSNAVAKSEERLSQLKFEPEIERANVNIEKNKNKIEPLQRRVDALERVLASGDDPATLVLESVNDFWAQSENAISKSKKRMIDMIPGMSENITKAFDIEEQLKAIDRSTPEGKQEYESLSAELESLWSKIETAVKNLPLPKEKVDENGKPVKTPWERYSAQKDNVVRWRERQNAMTQRGFVDMSDQDTTSAVQTIIDILKSSPTISGDIADMRGLKGGKIGNISNIQDVSYYSQVAQRAMGMRTQTSGEYDAEQQLRTQFVEMFRVKAMIQALRDMFPKNGMEPTRQAVEDFVAIFGNVQEMEPVVKAARSYLEERIKADEILAQDNVLSVLKGANIPDNRIIKDLWDELDEALRSELTSVLSGYGLSADDFKADDFSTVLSAMTKAYSSDAFKSINNESEAFNRLLVFLKQNTTTEARRAALEDAANARLRAFEDLPTRSGGKRGARKGSIGQTLYDMITPDKPLSVRIVNDKGEERIYDIRSPKQGSLDSDRSFTTTAGSLDRFLSRSGNFLRNPDLSQQMGAIVDAMFKEATMSAEELQQHIEAGGKTAQQMIDEFFDTNHIQLALKKDAFVPTRHQQYGFEDTPIGRNLTEQARLEKLLEAQRGQTQTDAIKRSIEQHTAELAALKAVKFSEKEIVESLAVLYNDTQIDEAQEKYYDQRARQAKRRSGKYSGENKSAYGQVLGQHKGSHNEFRDRYLTSLLENVAIADQYGTMDTSQLKPLIDAFNAQTAEAKRVTDLKDTGLVSQQEVDEAWAKWREARQALLDAFYKTEGWYITTYVKEQLERIDSETSTSIQKFEGADQDAHSQIAAAEEKIRQAHQDRMRAIEEDVWQMEREYLEGPRERATATRNRRAGEIRALEEEIKRRESELGAEADKDETLRQLRSDVFKRTQEDPAYQAAIRARNSSEIYSEQWTQYSNEAKAVEAKYSEEYYRARSEWIAKRKAELYDGYQALLDEIDAEIKRDDGSEIEAFNANLPEGAKPAETIADIQEYIRAKAAKLVSDEEERYKQELSQLDTSKALSPEDREGLIAGFKQEAERRKREVVDSVKTSSDAQLMSKFASEAQQYDEGMAKDAQASANVKKQLLQSLMQQFGITEEMLGIEQETAAAQKQRADVAGQTVESVISQYGASGSGSDFGFLETSGLATESTLQAILALLGGTTPERRADDVGQSTDAESASPVDTSAAKQKVVDAIVEEAAEAAVQDIKTAPTPDVSADTSAAVQKAAETVVKAVENTETSITHTESAVDIARNWYKTAAPTVYSQREVPAQHLITWIESALNPIFDPNYRNNTVGVADTIFFTGGMLGDGDANDIATHTEQYKALDSVLQMIGYHLGELQQSIIPGVGKWGFLAKIIPDANAITDAAKAREILYGASTPEDGIQRLRAEQAITAEKEAQVTAAQVVNQQEQQALTTVTQRAEVEQKITESAKTTELPDLSAISNEATKGLARYIGANFVGKGKHTKGAKQINAALYSSAKLLSVEDGHQYTDADQLAIAKALNQFEEGMQQDIKDKLTEDARKYIESVVAQLRKIVDTHNIDVQAVLKAEDLRLADAKNIHGTSMTEKSVEDALTYLDALKTDKGKRQIGAKRAKSGLKSVYGVLSSGKSTYGVEDLRELGTGYFQIVQTINHEIYGKLSEEVQTMLREARDEALKRLNEHGVRVIGIEDLNGKVVTEENQRLIHGAKIGQKFTSMTSPALVRTITSEDGQPQEKMIQQAEGRLSAEKAITAEKKKQAEASQAASKQDEAALSTATERAGAEQRVTEAQKKSTPPTPPSGGTPPSDSNPPSGTIIGLLSGLATENTLAQIAGMLSNGIKVEGSNKRASGGRSSKKKKSSDDSNLNLTADDALQRLQAEIQKKYPHVTSVGNLRPVSGGYAMDVFQPKNLAEVEATQERIAALVAAGQVGTEAWNKEQLVLNGLLKEQEKTTLRISSIDGSITSKTGIQNIALGFKAASKELDNVESVLMQLHDVGAVGFDADGNLAAQNSTVQKYLESVKELQTFMQNIPSDELFSPENSQRLSEMAMALRGCSKEVMALLKFSAQFSSGKMLGTLTEDIEKMSSSEIKTAMANMVTGGTELETTIGNLTPVTDALGNTYYQLSYSVRTGQHEIQEMTAYLNPLTREIIAQEGALKPFSTAWERFWGGLKSKFASILQYTASITSIGDMIRYLREGFQHVRDIDSALTELKKVTDETDASYNRFLQDMSKTASVVGGTVKNLTTMAAEWARLGYSMEEAGRLAKSTAILLNVSEFEDATKASEALISTMQAFSYTADESEHVVDILNEVGNNFAISSDGIATALQDSASALMEGGNNLEQAVALVAAANRVVQDPNSVGSALRTISLRLRGTSVKILEEMGEETDGVVESVSKLQAKIKALSGVDILTDAGEYKDTYTILKEISAVWEDMSDMDQAALLELMAGKNRANTLSAILSNAEDLERAYESALNAEGSAWRENEAYLDSIQGRVDQFNNEIQTMWMNAMDSDVIKFFVDVGTAIVGLVDKFGLLQSVIGGVSAFYIAKGNIQRELKALQDGTMQTLNIFKTKTQESVAVQAQETAVISQNIAAKNAKTAATQQVIAAQNTEQTVTKEATGAEIASATATQQKAAAENAEAAAEVISTATTNEDTSSTIANTIATQANTAATKAWIVVKNMAKGALIGLAMSLVTSAVIAFTSAIQDAIKTNEELIQQANDLKNAYQQETNSIQNNMATLRGVEDEFKRLASGVDDYGNNISLATDDYNRYLEIVDTILDMSPSLIEGYDAEGRAIANKNTLLSDSIRLMQQEQKWTAQRLTNNESLKEVAQGVDAEIEEYKLENPLPSDGASWDFIHVFEDAAERYSSDEQGNYAGTLYKALNPEKYSDDELWRYWQDYGDNTLSFASDYIDEIIADLRSENSKLRNYFTEEEIVDLLNIAAQHEMNVAAYNNDINAINRELVSALQAVPFTQDSYYTFSDQMQGFVTQFINGLDVTSENVEDKKQEIIDFIEFLADNSEVEDLLSTGFNLKAGRNADGDILNVAEYRQQVAAFKSMIQDSAYTDDQKNILLTMFGLDDDSQMDNEVENAINHVKNILKGETQEIDNYVNGLSISDLMIMYQISADPNSLTIDEYEQKVRELKVQNVNYETPIVDYASSVGAVTENIATYQEALEKLESGSFTMSDFVALIEQFPDLAKGVDVSSKNFNGLSKNLIRAIKASPDSLIDDLKDLRKELVATGKSTDGVDQLIESLENLPTDTVDSLAAKYGHLADKISEANTAQSKLEESMNENPDQNYETRGEAIEYLQGQLEKGEIGSESNTWNVAEQYGFTYDSAKSIYENAEALDEFIRVRDSWYEKDEDGNLTISGMENALNAVEAAVANSPELQELMTWSYEDGIFNFDFDNADLPEIIKYLNIAKETAGMTDAEFMDLLTRAGQFFDINWQDGEDVVSYIESLGDSGATSKEQLDAMDGSLRELLKENGLSEGLLDHDDAAISHLPADIQAAIRYYRVLKQEVKDDPLSITAQLNKDEGDNYELISEDDIAVLQQAADIIHDTESGTIWMDLDEARKTIQEAGGDVDDFNEAVERYGDAIVDLNTTELDPLGLESMNSDLTATYTYIDALGIKIRELDGVGSTIDLPSFIDLMKEAGWDNAQIADYVSNLNAQGYTFTYTTEENKVETLDVNTTEGQEKINALWEASNGLTDTETLTVNLDGTAEGAIRTMQARLTAMTGSSHKVTIYENTIKSTTYGGGNHADGTAHVLGTAYNSGSWGAKRTETALVGELGPELVVRNGRWMTVGENGAEFTEIRRGDIVFNHKQTESLLRNGYVTSRGRAYAEGTAYASGGGILTRYLFNSDGTSTKYTGSDALNKASSDISTAASDLSDAADEFQETFDWIEVRLEEIEEQLSLLNAQVENASNYSSKNSIIDSMINVNQIKANNLSAGIDEYAEYASKLLDKIPAKFQEAAQDGAIAITEFAGEADEATVEAINNYRDWIQKVADLRQQLEEVKSEIRDLARQKFDNVRESGDVRATVEDSQTEKLQDAVDLIEEMGNIASGEYYTAMMENSNKTVEYLTNTREEMQKVFDDAVKAGHIIRGSNEWYEMIDELYQVDSEIAEATKELEEFQNAINDIYWDNFDELINRIDYLKEETEGLIDLMDNDDLFVTPEGRTYEGGTEKFWSADEVEWTDEGLASLGLYAQRMEIAEFQARQYGEAIDDLTKDYADGKYSESEYYEKLNELTSAQYDSIEAYEEAQEAIVDLNKARLDTVKDGIEREISAYEELIEKQKEALDSEKDLYDFQKSTREQTKNISEIERRIAALSGDTSASAVAKRRQLEAELAEAKQALEESYYERSIDQQQEALDKSLEDFETEKNAEITKWEEYLENVETVVADSLGLVQANALGIYDTLGAKAEEYNLTLSGYIMSPWQDGALAISDYQTVFDTAMSSTTDQLDALKSKWQEVIDKMAEAAGKDVKKKHQENEKYTAAEYTPPVNEKPKEEQKKETSKKTISVGGKINASGAKIYGRAGGKGYNQYYGKDPVYTVLSQSGDWLQVRYHKLKSGTTGWFKKSDVKAYAKGTLGVDKDQWAWIDELGEELQLVPGKNGRLEYMKKGTSVVPADATINLMKWSDIDPRDMLERNRPAVDVPRVTNNEINIQMNIDKVVHVDTVTNDTLPDLTKAVEKQMDSYMSKLNSSLKRFTR